MDYKSAEAYLLSLQPGKIDLDLQRLKRVIKGLALDELGFPVVLVGGTNGKGSVIAMAEQILLKSTRVGAFVKPHLFTVRERARIQGEYASEELFCEALEELRAGLKRTEEYISFFEATLLTALLAFRRSEIELALVEVGLGGRFDASNALPSVLSAITSISYDHQPFLGPTLVGIAFEKAGIFRPGSKVILNRTLQNAPYGINRLLQGLAKVKGTHCIDLPVTAQSTKLTLLPSQQLVKLRRTNWDYHNALPFPRDVKINLLGKHQAFNLETAISIVSELAAMKCVTERTRVPKVIQANYRGRFEARICGNGLVIFDAAHNEEGFQALLSTLEGLFTRGEKFLLLFGCQEAKDPERMLSTIKSYIEKVIPIYLPILHPTPAEKISDVVRRLKLPLEGEGLPFDRQMELAVNYARSGGKVLAAGSIYYLGKIMEAFGHGVVDNPQENM